MKKKYQKPLFYKEPLVLTSSIASCNAVGEPKIGDPKSCAYLDENYIALFYGMTGTCEIIMEDGSTSNGYICYNIPNDSGNILFVNS